MLWALVVIYQLDLVNFLNYAYYRVSWGFGIGSFLGNLRSVVHPLAY